MKKKIIKKIMLIAGALLLLGFIFANIDYIRVKRGRAPILAVRVGKNKRTKADIYYGLGYMVVKCPEKGNNGAKYLNKYELFFLDNRSDCVNLYFDVQVNDNTF